MPDFSIQSMTKGCYLGCLFGWEAGTVRSSRTVGRASPQGIIGTNMWGTDTPPPLLRKHLSIYWLPILETYKHGHILICFVFLLANFIKVWGH